MQISSKLFNQQQLKQFSSTTEELQDLQNKISTGQNILKASDDPVGAVELSGLEVVKKQIMIIIITGKSFSLPTH